MNKKVPTWLGLVIIIGFAILMGCCIWASCRDSRKGHRLPAAKNINQENNEIAVCESKKGIKMNLEEAQSIASKEMECGNKFAGKNVCNDKTGTWWLDLDLKKKGCNPACVINIETKEAVINWRCTGLILPTK